jgi:hypothetical protein
VGLLADMVAAEVTNAGEGELFFSELAAARRAADQRGLVSPTRRPIGLD